MRSEEQIRQRIEILKNTPGHLKQRSDPVVINELEEILLNGNFKTYNLETERKIKFVDYEMLTEAAVAFEFAKANNLLICFDEVGVKREDLEYLLGYMSVCVQAAGAPIGNRDTSREVIARLQKVLEG